jgi:hypothetical protein
MTARSPDSQPLFTVPSAMQTLLNAINGFAYLVALDGTIIAVGEMSWQAADHVADSVDLIPVSTIGLCLFDGIVGAEVKAASRAMHDAVWTGRRTRTAFEYRCDGPMVERHMRMSMSAVTEHDVVVAILYQSQILHEIPRLPLSMFAKNRLASDTSEFSDDQFLYLCSYCHDVAWPIGVGQHDREWIRPEQYYVKGGPSEFIVSHGVCPACFERVVEPNS